MPFGGVSDGMAYSWLLRGFRPTNLECLTAFLDSLPVESGSGIAPTGYEYREYEKLARYSVFQVQSFIDLNSDIMAYHSGKFRPCLRGNQIG